MFCKTEEFLNTTKYILDVDFFVSKIAEHIVQNFEKLKATSNENFYKIETDDRAFCVLAKIETKKVEPDLNKIIFFKFENKSNKVRKNDTRIKNYIQKREKFIINIYQINSNRDINFKKLFRLFDNNAINFPILSSEQLELIKIADKNVIVQGVAGSGKTNVCIEKLVWCALKNYGGRVLYTTFSRGLLTDTKLKVEAFKLNIINFLQKLQDNKVIFCDEDKKTATENYLGVFLFSNEENIKSKLEKIVGFFDNNVDYFLIADLYKTYFEEKTFADERFFIKNYFPSIKNYNLQSNISKLKNISKELIFKEIFGLIFGFLGEDKSKITLEKYVELRKNSFSKQECEIIFQIAKDYEKYLLQNDMLDNNLASFKMLENIEKIPRYSLVIADEVQDFSQVNLNLFKMISLKMFCAGDALQMINPSYFSFGYLKNLLYEKDIISVAELKNNFRNTKKIQSVIDELEKINIAKFGTHNFVTTGVGIETTTDTKTIFCSDKNTIDEIAKQKFDSFTIVVPSVESKNELRKFLQNQEILTVEEIKGLERNSVLLYNILTDNIEKWQQLEYMIINKKTADENSVFRYYFNIFYVGISRAKSNLFVLEEKKPKCFDLLFEKEFENKNRASFVNSLIETVGKIEFTQDEYIERIAEFLKLEQYDNARFAADKITDDIERKNQFVTIDIYEKFVHNGRYREAGIKFWEAGLLQKAREEFILSGDTILIDFMDAISENSDATLNYEIVKYFLDMKESEVARNFILETIKNDLNTKRQNQRELNNKFKNLRGNKHGK